MNTMLELVDVAKPKGRPKTSERDDVAVKMDRAVVTKAKVVANHRGLPVAEVLSEAARSSVDREYLKVVRELEVSGGEG